MIRVRAFHSVYFSMLLDAPGAVELLTSSKVHYRFGLASSNRCCMTAPSPAWPPVSTAMPLARLKLPRP